MLRLSYPVEFTIFLFSWVSLNLLMMLIGIRPCIDSLSLVGIVRLYPAPS